MSASKLKLPAAELRTMLIVLCFVIACTFAQRLYVQKDMTVTGQHTLSPKSVETLALLTDPLEVEIFINPIDPQTESINSLLKKYQTEKANLDITLTDPALDPARMRQLDIAAGGELFIRYQNRTQRLTQVSEQTLTLALQRLARQDTGKFFFTTGHGERAINGSSNADLTLLSQQLLESGFSVNTIDLTAQNALSVSDSTVVIAGPLQRFLPQEVALLLGYISDGGNLIWLTEPDSDDGLKPLEIELGIKRLPGVVIDMAAQQLPIDRPDFAIANSYLRHPITEGFTTVTLFPQAGGLNYVGDQKWQALPVVQSTENSWTETGTIDSSITFGDDQRETQGTTPLIFALERDRSDKQQRIIISGDGDFLADAWIANGGNRDLANRLFNWSSGHTAIHSRAMDSIETGSQTDIQLELTQKSIYLLAAFALLLLPGLMFSVATGVWYRRQHG